MDQRICDAIEQKLVVKIYYDGGYRDIEPFCYGISRAGNETLRAYQVDGYSKSGMPYEWKMLRVDKIESWVPTGQQHTGSRHDYDPKDHHMTEVFCAI